MAPLCVRPGLVASPLVMPSCRDGQARLTCLPPSIAPNLPHTLRACRTDYDTYDYNNVLRRGIIDAFSGIVQGLGDEITAGTQVGAATRERLTHSLSSVYPFVASIGADKTPGETYSEDVARAAIALLGDLCVVMPVGGGPVAHVSGRLG